MTLTAWVGCIVCGLTFRTDGLVKNLFALHLSLSVGWHLLGVHPVTKPKSNLCTTLTGWCITEIGSVHSHAQDTIVFQANMC